MPGHRRPPRSSPPCSPGSPGPPTPLPRRALLQPAPAPRASPLRHGGRRRTLRLAFSSSAGDDCVVVFGIVEGEVARERLLEAPRRCPDIVVRRDHPRHARREVWVPRLLYHSEALLQPAPAPRASPLRHGGRRRTLRLAFSSSARRTASRVGCSRSRTAAPWPSATGCRFLLLPAELLCGATSAVGLVSISCSFSSGIIGLRATPNDLCSGCSRKPCSRSTDAATAPLIMTTMTASPSLEHDHFCGTCTGARRWHCFWKRAEHMCYLQIKENREKREERASEEKEISFAGQVKGKNLYHICLP
ncbi:hypothetical protein ACQJBY_060292 [Aegilops geniculata]